MKRGYKVRQNHIPSTLIHALRSLVKEDDCERTELGVSRLLVLLISSIMGALPTTLDADKQLLTAPMSAILRTAVLFRIRRKQLLQEVLDAASARVRCLQNQDQDRDSGDVFCEEVAIVALT